MNEPEWLRRYPLYALLGANVLGPWLDRGREYEFELGETLFTEGGKGEWAYLLLGGKVRAMRRNESGREVTLGMFESGDFFVDYAVLAPYANTATCRAAEFSRLLRFPLGPLRDLLSDCTRTTTRLKRWLQLHASLQCLRGRAFVGFMTGSS